MKVARFVIPLLLGAAAFAVNWLALKEIRKSPEIAHDYVVVGQDVSSGSEIDESMLESVKISGTSPMLEKLSKTAIPHSERSVLYGRQLTRSLSKSDIVFWRDVTTQSELSEPVLHLSLDSMEVISPLIKVGDGIAFLIPTTVGTQNTTVNYEEIGPYTVVTVGQVTTRPQLGATESRSENDRMITIALDKAVKPDELNSTEKAQTTYTTKNDNIRRLLDAMKRAEASSQAKIRVIQVPRDKMPRKDKG